MLVFFTEEREKKFYYDPTLNHEAGAEKEEEEEDEEEDEEDGEKRNKRKKWKVFCAIRKRGEPTNKG